MKTKKIWMWSFIFGLIATLIIYVTLFSGLSTDASTGTESEEKNEEEIAAETEPNVPEPLKREIVNPMAEISDGKRAISLYAALAEGVSGYIEPDSYVDVIAYDTSIEKDPEALEGDKDKEKKYKKATLILQKVKVLATGKSSDPTATALQYETVTLEVTPEEGVMLSLTAKDKDGFYFMLRNAEDKEVKTEIIEETREVLKEGDGEG